MTLASLVQRLDGAEVDEPELAAYLDLLDRALEYRRLTTAEADALHATAQDWGLDAEAVRRAHDTNLGALAAVALADGVVKPSERADLHAVADLLELREAAVDCALHARHDAKALLRRGEDAVLPKAPRSEGWCTW